MRHTNGKATTGLPPISSSGVSRPSNLDESRVIKALAEVDGFPSWWGGLQFKEAAIQFIKGYS